jgi:hypothetical protein
MTLLIIRLPSYNNYRRLIYSMDNWFGLRQVTGKRNRRMDLAVEGITTQDMQHIGDKSLMVVYTTGCTNVKTQNAEGVMGWNLAGTELHGNGVMECQRYQQME